MKNIPFTFAGLIAGFGTALAVLTGFGLLILAHQVNWGMIVILVGCVLAGFTVSNTLYGDHYQRPVYWSNGGDYYFSHMTLAWITKRTGLVGLVFILPVGLVLWFVYTITYLVMIWTGNIQLGG